MPEPTALRRTPLNSAHRALGARMVDFGGWDMPVQYEGVIAEHVATRTAAGLFDVSHMGEIEVRGPEALALVDRLTPNDASRLRPGRVQYSALTRPDGTFVDDILVYCRGAQDYLLVVNAANTAKDHDWVRSHATAGAEVRDVSGEWAQIAIQGPRAAEILQVLLPGLDLDSIGYYHFREHPVCGDPRAIVSRTGYTGEDGFEVYLAAARAEQLWQQALAAGEKRGLRPCGLGARDTLRLEARLPLYGNDIDETTTVIEADLGWIVKLDKGEFIGREALAREKATGPRRRLVGFEMVDRGIARHGHPARCAGGAAGCVTSGTYGPSVGRNIGLVFVPPSHAAPGSELEIEIRGQWLRARVVPTPFVPHRTRGAARRR